MTKAGLNDIQATWIVCSRCDTIINRDDDNRSRYLAALFSPYT